MVSTHQLSGRKVLVTGASGFLGSHLCRRLCQYGAEVHAVSRTLHSINQGCMQWWQGNFADLATVQNLLNRIKPDLIFHFSGQSTAEPKLELVLGTFYSLLTSTVNLLTAATQIGCRRILLTGSSMEPELGHMDSVLGSPYAAAKWASTAYGRMFHRLYQAPVVIVRPFMTYGPSQNVSKLIPYVTLSLSREEPPKLSNGLWQADWVYVDDVIDGFMAAAHSPNVDGCIIDLGSGSLVSIREVVQQITRLINSRVEPLFGALPDRPLEQVRVADQAYAYAKLGWKPKTSLDEGLRYTVDWYRRQLQNSTRTGTLV